jgi:hypothetical protein
VSLTVTTTEVEEDVDGGPPNGDLGAPTINVKTSMIAPLGGARAVDPRVPTINAKKHRRWAPWEVPELEIQERPPSTLRNVDGGPLGRCWSWRSGSAHHQH